jgi:putative addiction module component (TIGR02574 family)
VAIEKVMQDALALGDEDRETLLEALHQSFEPDGETLSPEQWDAAWSAELRRRLADHRDGRAVTYSHDDVMAGLRARLR